MRCALVLPSSLILVMKSRHAPIGTLLGQMLSTIVMSAIAVGQNFIKQMSVLV